MQIQFELLDESLVNIVCTWRNSLLSHEFLKTLRHLVCVLFFIEISNFASIQNTIHIFQKLLVNYLSVGKQEYVRSSLTS